MMRAFITGVAGTALSAEERRLIARTCPAGLILFSRNCVDGGQVRALVAEFRDATGDDRVLVSIDQEGGRVQRMRPPLSRLLPPAAAFGALYADDPSRALDAAYLVARLTADDLRGFGINCNCAPVLDVPVAGAHDIIGNRAYGRDPDIVTALGRAVANGLMDGGVVPVMKHIPGHGRATADSHVALPIVTSARSELEYRDFAPFRALRDLPAAMTAHVVYRTIDPAAPASISPAVLTEVIRGSIGFDGLLMSDDVSMHALSGTISERTRALFAAGCDLALHCNGDLGEMEQVADVAPPLAGEALRRFAAATAVLDRCMPFDREAAEAALGGILAVVA